MLMNQNQFSGFMWLIFFIKLKGELALAYESCAGGNSYWYCDYYVFYYLPLAGNNEPFRVPPSASSG